MSTPHFNRDAPAQSNTLSVFDAKAHAAAPQVPLKLPKEHESTVGDLLRSIQYRSFDALTDGVNNVVVDTPVVRADMYWVLLGASGTAAALVPGYGIFLMPPQLVGAQAPPVGDKFQGGGVRIDSGLNIAAIDRRIIVPPGWFVRLASFGGGAAPAAALHIGLFLAFVESPQLSSEAISLLTT
jgi:hypothetical protein